MSFREEIRTISTSKGKIDIYLVTPMPNDQFKLPYVCAIPDNIKHDSKLIVEVNNCEHDENGMIDYNEKDGKQKLIDQAINKLIGNNSNFGEMEHAQNVSAPIIMPIMPSVKDGVPYYQQLAKECFDNQDKQSKFYRVDEQIIEMIEDFRDMILYKDIELDEKIFLKGYSSSGVFAQRFAFLHPQIIDTALIGGAAGTIPLPSDCKGSSDLEYPLGTKDYENITGKRFDVNSYKNIKFQYFLAEFEELKKSDNRKNEIGLKAPIHDMSYMERSVPRVDGRKQREMYGKRLWKRFRKVIAEYEAKDYNINLEIYRKRVHGNSDISDDDFKKIYEGGKFKKNSNSIAKFRFKLKKMIDTVPTFFKLFKKKPIQMLPQGTDKYEELIKQIDIDDFVKMCKEKINSTKLYKQVGRMEKNYPNEIDGTKDFLKYPLKSKIDKDKALELTQSFFESINPELSEKVNDIISKKSERDGTKQYISLQTYPNDINLKYYNTKFDVNNRNYETIKDNACASVKNANDVMVYVPLNGDIRDVYRLVHEISHTFDTKNGENCTRRVMGEILPQCMERMMDEYLLNLSDEDCKKYQFKKDELKEDTQDRKKSTFLSRYHNAMDLEKKQGDREKNIRYTLAQIYQSQFLKLNKEGRKNIIMPFIQAIENDNMDEANKVFGMKINADETLSRKRYIFDLIDEIKSFNNGDVSYKKENRTSEKNKEINVVNEDR